MAVGIDAPYEVEIDGHVGYYCAGMNKHATVRVRGNCGVGVAENMMSGLVVVEGSASQSAGATARGGLLVIHGDASARCGISLKGADIVVRGSVGHMAAFMAQKGCLVVCGDAGESLGDSLYEARLYVRGSGDALGADCVEKEMRPEHVRPGALAARGRRGRRRGSGRLPPLRIGAPAVQLPRRQPGGVLRCLLRRVMNGVASGAARVGHVRPQRDRRDPAGGARGDVRHPRFWGQAARPALRRPAVPGRFGVALSARGLPREMRHRRGDRYSLRARARHAGHPDHDRRHELRCPVGAGQGGARARRHRGRDLDHDRRRRDDARGARALFRSRVPAAAVALRDEPRRPSARGCDRGRHRAGRQAGRRRACCSATRSPTGWPRCATCRRASISAARAATRTGPDRTTSRSRSRSCARSPTGGSRSTSRSARHARTTTWPWPSRPAPTPSFSTACRAGPPPPRTCSSSTSASRSSRRSRRRSSR